MIYYKIQINLFSPCKSSYYKKYGRKWTYYSKI